MNKITLSIVSILLICVIVFFFSISSNKQIEVSQTQTDVQVVTLEGVEGATWGEASNYFASISSDFSATADDLNCDEFSELELSQFEEIINLSCVDAKIEIARIADTTRSLSDAYSNLTQDQVTTEDVRSVLFYLDELDKDLNTPLIVSFIDSDGVQEWQAINEQNRLVLLSLLE